MVSKLCTGTNCSLNLMPQVLESSDYQVSQIPVQNKKEEAVLQKLKQTCVIPWEEWGNLHRLRRKENEFM